MARSAADGVQQGLGAQPQAGPGAAPLAGAEVRGAEPEPPEYFQDLFVLGCRKSLQNLGNYLL